MWEPIQRDSLFIVDWVSMNETRTLNGFGSNTSANEAAMGAYF